MERKPAKGNRFFTPNVSPCGFVRDFGKEKKEKKIMIQSGRERTDEKNEKGQDRWGS